MSSLYIVLFCKFYVTIWCKDNKLIIYLSNKLIIYLSIYLNKENDISRADTATLPVL